MIPSNLMVDSAPSKDNGERKGNDHLYSRAVQDVISTCRKRFGINPDRFKDNLVFRGSVDRVEEVKQFVNEAFTGFAERVIVLNVNQMKQLLKDPKLVKAVEQECFESGNIDSGNGVIVDEDSGVIHIRGPAKLAATAHSKLFSRLQDAFKGEIVSIDMPPACLGGVSRYSLAKEVGDDLSVTVEIDRVNGTVRLCGEEADVSRFVQTLNAKKEEFSGRHTVVAVETSVAGALVAKRGAHLTALAETTGCNIMFNRDSCSLSVEAESPQQLESALKHIQERLEEMRTEHWEHQLEQIFLGRLLGKGGSNIKQLRADSGASIDMQADSRLVTVSGSKEAVEKAKLLILNQLEEFEARDYSVDMRVPEAALPALIGPKGATIRSLEEKSEAKIDVNRGKKLVTLRGPKKHCQVASELISEILKDGDFLDTPDKVGKDKSSKSEAPVVADVVDEVDKPSAIKLKHVEIPGLAPGMRAQMVHRGDVGMSKSAQRRFRRKMNALEPTVDSEDSVTGEPQVETVEDVSSLSTLPLSSVSSSVVSPIDPLSASAVNGLTTEKNSPTPVSSVALPVPPPLQVSNVAPAKPVVSVGPHNHTFGGGAAMHPPIGAGVIQPPGDLSSLLSSVGTVPSGDSRIKFKSGLSVRL